MKINWIEQTVPLKDLKPYERNPRRISKEAFAHLKRSMEEDGYHGRLLCTPDLKVIGGHQRLKVMKELGWKEAKVLTPDRDLTEEEYRRLLIRDNLQAGEWDVDMLANDFEPEELLDWGFPENLLPKQEGVVNEPEGDEDAAPEAPAVPQTIRGDLYEIGPHRLLCGDSTLIDDVDKLMDGAKADMVFTDPPYGINYETIKAPKKHKVLNDDKFGDLTTTFVACRDKAEKYICCDWRSLRDVQSSVEEMGEKVKAVIVWDKTGGHDRPALSHVFMKWGFCHEFIAFVGKQGGERYMFADVFRHERIMPSEANHATSKPVALCERCIEVSSSPKELVIDYFGGSGSTMVAAHKLGRTAYLMELDEKYCDVIVQRMHKLFPDLPITRNGIPFAVKVVENGKS